MATSDETTKKPLWLSIEERFLELDPQNVSGENKEAAIQEIAGGLDAAGYNVSRHGGNMLELRWAVDEMLNVGRPLMAAFNEKVAALTLEDVYDPYAATNKLIDDLGGTWTEFRKSDRRPEVIRIVEETRLGLLVEKAKGMPDDEGIRYLIEENVESGGILAALGITEEKLAEVSAQIEKERAERAKVERLLEEAAEKPVEEKVRSLLENDVSEQLMIEIGQIDQAAIDSVKQAMEEELKEKQRLAEEEAARKKAEAEGPALEDIPADQMLDYIEAIREILEFSDVEKDIRTMCDQSAIPKGLVDIAVSEPDRLDELEKAAEG